MADDAAAGVVADTVRVRPARRVPVGPAADDALDRLADLVVRLLDVPVALVSVVADERQFFPGQSGLAEPLRSRREMPLANSLTRHVVATGSALVISDVSADPRFRDDPAPDLGVCAYAGVPLTDADGRTLGALCAWDRVAREWTASELALLTDLAAVCSSELRLRIARARAEDARRLAESAHDQLAMLAELTETLAATLDVEEALRRLAATVTPGLGDWCSVSLLDGDGRIRRVADAHRDPRRAAEVDRFADLTLARIPDCEVLREVQRTGRPYRMDHRTVDHLRRRASDPEVNDLALRLGYSSQLTAPIIAPLSRRVLGTITLLNGSARPAFTEADERIAMDIGRRAGLAIDNSRLYRRQRHMVEVLQDSMLPDLPSIADVELHARYLPAEDGAAVGGDWYDAFVQPDGSVMLAVGDVSGHDIEAAATMGQLRNLVRGEAFGRDDEPGALLTQLDRALHGLHVPAAATAVLARLRRAGDDYVVTFSNAGHPPPVLLRPDGDVEVWWTEPEPLLGLIPHSSRTTHRRTVPAGSTLLLYTDGLVEDPAHLIDAGIARVTSVLQGEVNLPGEELCARLIDAASRRADDIALLLVRLAAG